MKLEVGMYVRTKYCGICDEIAIRKIIKIDKINNNWFYIDKNVCDIYKDYTNKINTVNVEKASFDIIDILEVEDYVNGYKIGYIDDCKGAMREFYYDYENSNEDVGHWEEEIKSVITHEQIEQISYRIGE